MVCQESICFFSSPLDKNYQATTLQGVSNVVSVKLSDEEIAACDRAAAEAGMSRHRWIVTVLAAASGGSALPQQLMRVVAFVPPKPVRDGKW
jgi:predicted DNA binding CopG/RHH family protein